MPCSKPASKAITITAVAFFSVITPLEETFASFKWLDIARIYDDYSAIIDFFIYLIIFTGIAQATLGKRFGEKGGKAITTGIGILLAISLAVTEKTMDFNLRAFGPVAACLFVALVGISLFFIAKELGGGSAGAAAVAFIIAYFSLRAVTPAVFNWLADKVPIIHVVLAVAIFVAIYQVIATTLHKMTPGAGALSSVLHEPKEVARRILPGYEKWEQLRLEAATVGRKIEPLLAQEHKESKQIIADLEAAAKLIDEQRESEKARAVIAKHLVDIIPREHHLVQALNAVREIDARIEAFDLSLFGNLRKVYPKLSAKRRDLLKAAILQEREKIGCEEKIKSLSVGAERIATNIVNCLKIAAENLTAGYVEEAKRWIGEAIKYESETTSLLTRIRKLEALLMQLASRQLKEFKLAQAISK
jgi:hypothetical protein